jgi:hypothetical protein
MLNLETHTRPAENLSLRFRALQARVDTLHNRVPLAEADRPRLEVPGGLEVALDLDSRGARAGAPRCRRNDLANVSRARSSDEFAAGT